jgi:hypothetical protein
MVNKATLGKGSGLAAQKWTAEYQRCSDKSLLTGDNI